MSQTPLTVPNFGATICFGALGLDTSSRYGFDNPPRPQYNPPYIRCTDPPPNTVLGAD